MRYNIQGIARTSYGVILPYNDIKIYINNTNTPAIVYESKNSVVKKSIIKTDRHGKFNIYFDSDDYDYNNLNVTFDLEIDGNKVSDIQVFTTDKRVLNTNETFTEDNIKEVIQNLDFNINNIDGGTF